MFIAFIAMLVVRVLVGVAAALAAVVRAGVVGMVVHDCVVVPMGRAAVVVVSRIPVKIAVPALRAISLETGVGRITMRQVVVPVEIP